MSHCDNFRNIRYLARKNINDTIKPVVKEAIWGKLTISFNGKVSEYRDAILWPTGHMEWDWRLSNTHHKPGIQINEIKELLDTGECNEIILTTGFEDVLQVDPKTVKWLDRKNIEYKIMSTLDAIKYYNQSSVKKAGILIHSTC